MDSGSAYNMLLWLEIFFGVMGGHEVMNLSSVVFFAIARKGEVKD